VLFTFPSRYWFTIGHQRVFSLARWSSQLPTGFHVSRGTQGSCPPSQSRCRLQDCHLLWSLFPSGSTNNLVDNSAALRPNRPYNPREQALWFGLLRVRSPLLAESLSCFLFLQVLRWFTSLRCLPHPYEFRMGYLDITQGGFPHSDIPGSTPACGSPGLIAACHVLHRLLVPRHSPYALSSLTK
jgi:hypothetical protein